jgi:hypothetical protein
MSDKGLVSVDLKDKTAEGKIRVKYHFTPLRTAAVTISVVSALLIIACYGAMAVKRKKKSKTAEAETAAAAENPTENKTETETNAAKAEVSTETEIKTE